MDKIEQKKNLLESIHLMVDTTFECDEQAVMEAFQSQAENQSSLAIKILSIFGGFMATLAFMGFLVLAGLYNSEMGMLIFGVGFIVGALVLNKQFDILLIDTFSISIFISGFGLLAFGLLGQDFDENHVALLFMMIALCSMVVTQNFILSFISTLIISGSLMTLILDSNQYDLIHLYNTIYTIALTYVFLNEAKFISMTSKLTKLYNPVKTGLIFSLLFGLIITGKRGIIPIAENYVWLSSIVMVAVVLYLIKTIMKINEVETLKNKVLIYALCALILLSTVFSPAISGAIIIILLSFMVNYRTGLAIGVISVIYFISQYYYDLNFTLLTKSILLFSSGVLFLLLYFFTSKNLKSDEKI